ncbi:PLP-dependent aminotransferase family protein [Paracoccus indicus]|uniref:MocR-like pyridoxine biosynthesis transcription factor PdxR n=1 Tax=Paracoccus indicus TaxID=2079229 RepID=UPI000D3CA6CE|nr:PLP-dependent aminotransferase family protein [Paracoccus indicus]
MPIPPEIFLLPHGSTATLQQQIQQIVADAIVTGRCSPGERLPSSRRLAQHLGVSRITVTLAYSDLVSNEYLHARGGSGFYVSENAPRRPAYDDAPHDKATGIEWQRRLRKGIPERDDILRPPNWSDYRYPFIYGQSDTDLFDHANWRKCAMQAMGRKDFDSLTRDTYQQDDPLLVEYILRHILPRRGIHATPDELIVTMGSQNALWMIAHLLLDQSPRTVVENPCYPGLRKIFDQKGVVVTSVDVDDDGLPPEDLPRECDLVFTTPSHQAPTNATMPLSRRKALLERAERDDFLVVEDDYEFEISFLRSPSPALKSMDRQGRVIYVSSFSKSIFPGLRLGYIVAAPELIREVRRLRSVVLRHPPSHLQRTTAYFLSLGHFDSQLHRMTRVYAQRRAIMEKGLQDLGIGRVRPGASGGSSFWIEAPPGIDTSNLAMKLRGQSVLIEPGQAFFARRSPDTSHYRLAYSTIPTNRIQAGMELIAAALSSTRRGA